MLSDELRKRISEISRTARRSLPGTATDGSWESHPLSGPPKVRFLPIEQATKGKEVLWPPTRFLLIEKPLSEFCQATDDFINHFHSSLRRQESLSKGDDLGWDELLTHPPSSWLFLDIETCGLTNSPVFLVGLFFLKEGQFQLEQLLARDYSEEAAILNYLSHRIQDFQVLLTFNGKSFDWPFLVDRSSIHGATLLDRSVHFDVLHAARKQWKHTLPNCKLQTLERYICHRIRYGDIPGALIPEAYHQFVKTGNAMQLGDILHHNALDLFTTSEITLHLLCGGDATTL